jgi:ubiquinol-cytochrome c reductase cytochrome b/c1 subunit
LGLVRRRSPADEHAPQPTKQKWSFAGPFGKFDRGAVAARLQGLSRGLPILSQPVAGRFRTLGDPGGPAFTLPQVRAIALDYKVQDGTERRRRNVRASGPARGDRFPEAVRETTMAARAANGGALPPDLSVIGKGAHLRARRLLVSWLDIVTQYQEQGPDYLTALLQGYEPAPKGFDLPSGTHYNKYFPGHAIGMPPPAHRWPGDL